MKNEKKKKTNKQTKQKNKKTKRSTLPDVLGWFVLSSIEYGNDARISFSVREYEVGASLKSGNLLIPSDVFMPFCFLIEAIRSDENFFSFPSPFPSR